LTVTEGLLLTLNGLRASFKCEEQYKNSMHYERRTSAKVFVLKVVKIWMKLG